MKQIISFLAIAFLISNSFSQSTTEIAKKGINSTVSIIALDNVSQPLGYGSGFIIDDELIATNVHVVEGSSAAYVLLNGQEKKYTVNGFVSIDKANDLVILKVSGLYGTKLPLGSDIPPEIGEKIYAVGNPKGLNGTFSEGIVSGIRDIATNKVLQITAPISPGSSGGPVLNSAGQVVGISFASFTSGQNLNFAIPVKYLINLKTKIGALVSISTIKPQPKKTAETTVNPNIKEGISVRNIKIEYSEYVTFSIKNNLGYTVSDIRILILVLDDTGTVVDYNEKTYFINKWEDGSINSDGNIKAFLAKTIDQDNYSPKVHFKTGYKVKARVLDFKIVEE